MFSPSRDQARLFFIEAWEKYWNKAALTPLESLAVDLILLHPEYHQLLEDRDSAAKEWSPEDGQVNPFLHLSLHLAIEEQLSINQPPGIKPGFDALLLHHDGNRHDALHDVLEALGETIWRAQRDGSPLDGAAYVQSVRKKAGLGDE